MNDENFNTKNDLKERSFEFAKRIIFLCQKLEQSPGVTRTISNQLIRSGTSIGVILRKHMGVSRRQISLLKCTSHARKPEKQIIGFVY